MNRISNRTLAKVSFRLSLLQSTWFEGGMQSIGLAYCLIPGLKSLYPDPEEMQAAVRRYAQPFNTHPFLVGFIAGALLKMEEQRQDPYAITCFSASTMGVLAAFGDPFFRGAMPAFVTLAACLAAILGGPVAGIVTLLFLFNSAHLLVRLGGVSIGYREGCNVILLVGRWFSPERTKQIKSVAAVFGGIVLVAVVATFSAAAPGPWLAFPASVACIAVGIALTKWIRLQHHAIPLVIFFLVLIEVAI